MTQFATARVGAILVTINPAYKAGELEYALRKAGVSLLVMARGFREADYVAMLEQVRGGCPQLRATVVLDDDWDAFLADGASVSDRRARRARGVARSRTTRSTSSTPRARPASPRARRCRTATSSTTPTSSRSALRYTEHDRVCVPVPFYHCFGMVLGNLACATHGACVVVPGESFDPRDVLAAVAGRALHLALRRADDVHRRARRARLRELRPDAACGPGRWAARRARSR